MSQELIELLKASREAAAEAGRITLRYFQQSNYAVEIKADQSPVTIADKSAEEWIVQFVQREFPDHGILGEEFGEIKGKSHYRWIIDPIDGTKSFIHGVPLYGNLIGIEDLRIEDAVVGVMNFPALEEMLYASKGHGTFWNEVRAEVSKVSQFKDAVLLVTDIQHAEAHKNRHLFDELMRKTKFARTWGDCYGHALVATGRAEIMLDPKVNLWDVAALKPVIEEAGGKFFDWNGECALYVKDAIACNRELHDLLQKEVS